MTEDQRQGFGHLVEGRHVKSKLHSFPFTCESASYGSGRAKLCTPRAVALERNPGWIKSEAPVGIGLLFLPVFVRKYLE